MKVVTPEEMRQQEQAAYDKGFQEESFMEAAGKGVALAADAYIRAHRLPKKVALLIGKGNNGGDAYVAGRHLISQGHEVFSIQPLPMQSCSPLLQQQAEHFTSAGGTIVQDFEEWVLELSKASLLIDGIFGTGFKGVVKGDLATLIEQANASNLPILAVDIPSGLDGATGLTSGPAIKAKQTCFLEYPKQGFFLEKGWELVGELIPVSFGLPEEVKSHLNARSKVLSRTEMKALLPPIPRSRNKYQAGYVVGWAGSPGMAGAAILSGNATLKGGAGITRLYHPRGMEGEFAQAMPELILRSFDSHAFPEEMVKEWSRATALYFGPGIGLGEESQRLIKELLPQVKLPILLDADALTLIANLQLKPPKRAILTPHLGELKRLLQLSETPHPNLELWQQCSSYVKEHEITLVVKGSPTFIFSPNQPIAILTRGDPGMATAGSGDVLSGLLAALLSQKLGSYEAACLGTYLHAYAGEIAAQRETSYAMTASSILHYLPQAFRELLNQ